MIQIGGTKRIPIFLSQGTYGCVYRPGIQCGTNATLGKQFISKIHRKEKYAEKEINNSNKIKKMIPQHARYFAISLTNCNVNVKKVEGNEMQKCDFIRNSASDISETGRPTVDFVSTKMRYVDGTSLGNFLDRVKLKIDSQIFSICKRLYLCIQKLQEIKMVHYDLKENNMIIKTNTGLPVLIDFGLSIDMDVFIDKNENKILSDLSIEIYRKYFYVYATDYVPWHIDIDIICYIVQELREDGWMNSIDYTRLEEIYDHWFQAYLKRKSRLSENQKRFWKKMRETIPGDLVKQCFMEKTQYLEMLKGMNLGNWKDLADNLILRWKLWDIYALCVL
jgi:serine/threonine protein kinase